MKKFIFVIILIACAYFAGFHHAKIIYKYHGTVQQWFQYKMSTIHDRATKEFAR